jgi:peptidoglycan hydrolase-like protein with peptidoglycan-binding domain
MTTYKVATFPLSNNFFKTSVAAIALIVLSIPYLTHANMLGRYLSIGMSGSDVRALQVFLAQDSTIYPQGTITGYFGVLTKSAVSNFQSRNNISAIGRVGPATLAAINAQMGGIVIGNSFNSYPSPVITSVNLSTSRNAANVSWNTSELAKGVVYYSSNPLITYERENSVDVSGSIAMTDASVRMSQNISIQGLNPNTTYYYMIYSTNQAGNASVTVPSTFQTSN